MHIAFLCLLSVAIIGDSLYAAEQDGEWVLVVNNNSRLVTNKTESKNSILTNKKTQVSLSEKPNSRQTSNKQTRNLRQRASSTTTINNVKDAKKELEVVQKTTSLTHLSSQESVPLCIEIQDKSISSSDSEEENNNQQTSNSKTHSYEEKDKKNIFGNCCSIKTLTLLCKSLITALTSIKIFELIRS
ncbi:MAG: hypothetical protein WCD44_01165 [Candidatus Babeliales bacterium]